MEACMKLLYQTHSPYARKVLVAAHELGLADRLEVIHHETSPTRRNDEVFGLNPLGKVPVLVDAGLTLFDSNVICEYLDRLDGRAKLVPADPAARYRTLTLQALAQGVADAGIAVRWEVERRPEALRWPAMRDGQQAKIVAACDYLEAQMGDNGLAPDLGAIAVATTLSWIEFRDVYAFRPGRPRLAAWYAGFCERPSMLATALSGDTRD
jgi:glutathione S-transferase